MQVTMRAKVRWWLKLWIYGAIIFNHFFGWRINEAKAAAIIKRGVYVELIK